MPAITVNTVIIKTLAAILATTEILEITVTLEIIVTSGIIGTLETIEITTRVGSSVSIVSTVTTATPSPIALKFVARRSIKCLECRHTTA